MKIIAFFIAILQTNNVFAKKCPPKPIVQGRFSDSIQTLFSELDINKTAYGIFREGGSMPTVDHQYKLLYKGLPLTNTFPSTLSSLLKKLVNNCTNGGIFPESDLSVLNLLLFMYYSDSKDLLPATKHFFDSSVHWLWISEILKLLGNIAEESEQNAMNSHNLAISLNGMFFQGSQITNLKFTALLEFWIDNYKNLIH